MLFDSVNIQTELLKQQQKSSEPLDEIILLLDSATANDKEVLERLSANKQDAPLHVNETQLDKSRIFTLDTINQICVKYRLRFLDSKHFKSPFPYEAIYQINCFEKQQDLKIQKFKIIAPYGMFHLSDANEDPLLFAQISETKFYLLHKWGQDLKWYRAILNFPLQSIYTFFFSAVLLAAVVAWSFPFDWLNVNKENEVLFRFWLNTHFTIAFFFFFLFLGSLSNASFSDSAWDNKYYNR